MIAGGTRGAILAHASPDISMLEILVVELERTVLVLGANLVLHSGRWSAAREMNGPHAQFVHGALF